MGASTCQIGSPLKPRFHFDGNGLAFRPLNLGFWNSGCKESWGGASNARPIAPHMGRSLARYRGTSLIRNRHTP
jgi:hypothetical protein